MATSRFETLQYPAQSFVESAGAVLFHRSTHRICLVRHPQTNEWLLAKGRRNVGEAPAQAAVREVTEETGLRCQLLPVTLNTRAPPATETGHCPDEARLHTHVCEPFMMTCRFLESGKGLKLITWYIAEIHQDAAVSGGDDTFKVGLFGFRQTLDKLTFQLDRDIVRKAISIFETSYPSEDTFCPYDET